MNNYIHVKQGDVIPPPWASCQIRKIAGAHAPGMPGTFSPSPQVSDPDMHHGTCVTQLPGIPGACATCNFTYLVRGPYLSLPPMESRCVRSNYIYIKQGVWLHIHVLILFKTLLRMRSGYYVLHFSLQISSDTEIASLWLVFFIVSFYNHNCAERWTSNA